MNDLRLGFLSANSRRGSHYDDFLELVPDGVSLDIVPLGLWRDSLYDLQGKTDEHIALTVRLVEEHGWDGVALMGAPMQVQNPEHIGMLRDALSIPVTTALESGAAAVKAFGAIDILLLTPFDDGLNLLLREFLVTAGLDVTIPMTDRTDTRREDVDSTERKTAEEVYRLAVGAYQDAAGCQAIYFQGAPLNPLKVLERLEDDLHVPVVASNPAMLWHIVSLLGQRFSVQRGGALLREWPQVLET